MPVTFVDPRGEVSDHDQPYELAVDLAALPGPVALLANGFPDSGAFLDVVAEALVSAVPGLEVRRFDKDNASAPASEELVKEVAAGSVAAVTAYGH